jgi:putative DNA primase/helicase
MIPSSSSKAKKKVEAARQRFPDYIPISPMNGANSPHKSKDWPLLAGRPVVIWPDADEPGTAFAAAAAALASDAGAASVAVVTIPEEWPDKWDLADALPDGVSPDDLAQMLQSAERRVVSKPAAEQPARRSKLQKKTAPEQEIKREVCRLVTVSPVKYVMERGEAAERLGIGVSSLDRLVKIERGDADISRSGDDRAMAGSGRALEFPEIDPWPDSVDGAQLLTDLSRTLRNYVILTQAQGDAVTLWVCMTHAFDAVEVSPKLLVKSTEPRSGKTRLLEAVALLVPRPQSSANIKAATLFRVIEEYRATLLLDEVDTFIKDDPQLHGIINSGFNKASAKVLRAVQTGDAWVVREFSTWCPQAIAGIGNMPITIVDRSFLIEMKRKLRTEKVKRLRRRDAGPLVELARKAARWAADHAAELAVIDPAMPEALNDRAMDAWEFCVAIADLAGGEWPKRARAAALSLSGDEAVEDGSINVKLLADIRSAFVQRKVDRMTTDDIVGYLIELDLTSGHGLTGRTASR